MKIIETDSPNEKSALKGQAFRGNIANVSGSLVLSPKWRKRS